MKIFLKLPAKLFRRPWPKQGKSSESITKHAAARSDVVKQQWPDLVAMESHLNTSIELKLETVSRQYRQRLLTLVGISAHIGPD